jgi:hypothetical protein
MHIIFDGDDNWQGWINAGAYRVQTLGPLTRLERIQRWQGKIRGRSLRGSGEGRGLLCQWGLGNHKGLIPALTIDMMKMYD